MFYRMLVAIISDLIRSPDYIFVHRRIISTYMPSFMFLILERILSRGTKLIWDFDDDILDNHEISRKNFNQMARLSSVITVTHEYLASLLPSEYQYKVHILPTTDGDLYKIYQKNRHEINKKRIESMFSHITLVWVATSSNLQYLESVIDYLDEAAKCLYEVRCIKLHLKVICDKPLMSRVNYIVVENIKWTREKAISGMIEANIGIMPLKNSVFTQGKGGFKLVQYLSIGLPCIASSVGFNKHVIDSKCGVLIDNNQEWFNAIQKLSNINNYNEYCNNAYQRWYQKFNYETNLQFFKSLFNAL